MHTLDGHALRQQLDIIRDLETAQARLRLRSFYSGFAETAASLFFCYIDSTHRGKQDKPQDGKAMLDQTYAMLRESCRPRRPGSGVRLGGLETVTLQEIESPPQRQI